MKYKFTKALIFIAVLVCIFAFPQIAGAEQFPVEGTNATLTYTVSGSKATITDCNEDATGVLVIPSTIGDNTVVQINTDAFANCALLTAITVPDSVKTIQAQAFKGCTSLEEMTLPFIGESSGGSGYSNCVFGYIFEKSDSSDTSAVKQYPGDGTLYAR
ncbi:MAG: leucine-rich repeat protein, partial [Clostridia bacterium]|nr:leucine-rich repeat protein [Clostridia bacterium]